MDELKVLGNMLTATKLEDVERLKSITTRLQELAHEHNKRST